MLTPLTTFGQARTGTSNRGGALLESAQRSYDDTYPEVVRSGLGALYCLGAEVFGRCSEQPIQLVPALARERTRGVHPRHRRCTALLLQRRWWGILGIALQRSVAHTALYCGNGADLATGALEPVPWLADISALD